MFPSVFPKRSLRFAIIGVVAVLGTMPFERKASAQYSSSLYFTIHAPVLPILSNWAWGNHSAYAGLGYSQNGRSYSAGSGYMGHAHYQHQTYHIPSYAYGYTSGYASGYKSRHSSGCRR